MVRLTWIFLSITCILLPSVCEGKVKFFDRLKSPKCSQSKSCPPEGNYDLRQILCDYSCLDGNSYTCLEHGDGEYILEFCSPQLQCEPGKRGVFTIDDNDPMKVKMTETSCPPDRYQREISDCIDACKGNRNDFSYLSDMFIVYSNGSLVSPPEVYCNYTGGYYSPENITLFYFDNTFQNSYGTYCKHVSENDPCLKGWMPLPNGTCVQPCMKGYERDDHDSFVCKPQSHDPNNVDDKILSTQPTDFPHSTTESKKNQTSYLAIKVIPGTAGGMGIIVAIVLLCYYFCCYKRRTFRGKGHQHENGNVEANPDDALDDDEETPLQEHANRRSTPSNGTRYEVDKETTSNGIKEQPLLNGADVPKIEEPLLNDADVPKIEPVLNGAVVKPNIEEPLLNGAVVTPQKEEPIPRAEVIIPKTEEPVLSVDAVPGEKMYEESQPVVKDIGKHIRKDGEFKKKQDDTSTQTESNAKNAQFVSVGSIIYNGDVAGTAFRVASNHVMTACHVILNIIKRDKDGSNEDSNFDWSELSKAYVNFNESITENPKKVSTLKCVYYNIILDFAVLEFELKLDLPRKMVLNRFTDMNPHLVYVYGFGNPNSICKKHIDQCEVIPSNDDKIRSALAWLRGEGMRYREKVNPAHFDLGYYGYDDEHKILLNSYLEHGASGAPILAFDHTHINMKVVGLYTNGMPDFFFKLPKGDQKSFPEKYRFEYGTRMCNIYQDMRENCPELAKDAFGESEEVQGQQEELVNYAPG